MIYELYYVYNETKTHTYLAQIKYGTGSDSLYVVVDADSDIDMEKEILSRYMQGQFDIDGNGDSMVDVDIMSGDSEFREMVITELYK